MKAFHQKKKLVKGFIKYVWNYAPDAPVIWMACAENSVALRWQGPPKSGPVVLITSGRHGITGLPLPAHDLLDSASQRILSYLILRQNDIQSAGADPDCGRIVGKFIADTKPGAYFHRKVKQRPG